MTSIFRLLSILIITLSFPSHAQRIMDRSGKATFFSEAPVENISASNDQVLAVIDLKNGEVAVSMLMKGFNFRKALMQQHFNESYVESDKYPKATFTGKIEEYSPGILEKEDSVKVSGQLTIHGVAQPLTTIILVAKEAGNIRVTTNFPVRVEDHDIEIPSVVMNNIAEVVDVSVSLLLKPE